MWADSAAKHGIPHDEALYAIAHAEKFVESFGRPRVGGRAPSLFIGPSRHGTLEVLAIVTPPREVWVFHVMRLRESTARAAEYVA
jgi:hypothetical protein